MLYLALKGRLGNQMFQYAAVRTHAEKKGMRFLYGGSNVLISQCFELDNKSFRQNILSKISLLFWMKRIKHEFTPQYIEYSAECIGETYDPQFYNVGSSTKISGWFQSEKYFRENHQNVLQWFKPKARYRKLINEIEQKLPVPSNQRCCIHIRRTDYAVADMGLGYQEQGWQLPLSYYHDVIRSLPSDLFYIIVSDDPDFAEDAFSSLKNKLVSRSPHAVVDMFLMTRCRINVISNSTFSWWGAWCNQIDDKLVIAPKYFLGWANKFWFPSDIEVPEWKYIDIQLEQKK